MTWAADWTDELIERVGDVLRWYGTVADALPAIERELGLSLTKDSLRRGFNSRGRSPGEFLGRRDTLRMKVATAVELPDDSATTESAPPTPRSQPPVVIVDDSPETEPESTASEVAAHRLRTQLADEKAARTRLLKEIADRDEQIAILQELRARDPLPPIEERATVGAMQRQGVPVLVCSDWHVEEPVDPKKVNGLNEYSLEIADARIDRLAEAFEWLLRDARFDCRTAVVALLGDLLSGYIHIELEEANFLSPTQAILWLSVRLERLLRRIASLCPALERIIVACCDGNHGRNTNKIRVSTRTANSLEWLLYHTLAAKMADDPRFEFRIADGEWLFVDVFGQTIAFTHGDSFQYGGGVGGISIPIRRGISRQFQGRKIAKFCMGHFHQQQDFGDILINGSMIGYTPYGMRVHAPYERPKQSWFLWDSREGQALSAPVWL